MPAHVSPSRRQLFAVIALAAMLGACSGNASSSPTSSATPALASTPNASGLVATTVPAASAPAGAVSVSMTCFRFAPSDLTAKAGSVTFFLENADPESGICQRGHNLVIGTQDGYELAMSDYVMNGKSSVFVVEGLAAGGYAIWCSVDSHKQQGQIGSLTVTP